jgi:hypothetical protein
LTLSVFNLLEPKIMALYIDAPTARRVAYQGWDKQWINGSLRTGKSRHVVNDVDPFTGETPAADTQDLDAAYRAARDAGRAWAAELPAHYILLGRARPAF